MAGNSGGRLFYADLLRIAATFAVMVVHISGAWISEVPVDSAAWNILNLYDGLAHWCVPIFIMLSGMFLLDPQRELTLRTLFRRHILRIVVAMVVWSLVYSLATSFLATRTLTVESFAAAVRNLVWGKLHYHLWFLPMILGLYLVTPILRGFVRGATARELQWYFLLVLIVTMLLPTVLALRPSKTVSSWLTQLDIRVVLSYAGYFVLGYCLKTCVLSPAMERLIYLLGIGGAVWSVLGTVWLSHIAGARFTFYNYNTPNVALMSAAVFLLFRRISPNGRASKWVTGLSSITFGMYLCHDLFLQVLRGLGVTTLSFSPVLSVPLLSLVVFVCSALLAWLLSKLPLVGRLIT